MVAFYKHNIPSWRGGTAHLSDRAFRVYHVLIEEMMLQEGPVVLHERTLAGLSNRSTRDLRGALDELVAAGKIRIEGGKIHNDRAAAELSAIRSNRENAAKGGRKVREWSANGPRMVSEPSANGPRKVAETQEKPSDFSGPFGAPLELPKKPKREEKTREECVDAREKKIALDKQLVGVFQSLGRLPPAMHLTEVWLAQGYPPDLIVSVVSAKLRAAPATKTVSLAWFTEGLKEAANGLAPKLAAKPSMVRMANGTEKSEAFIRAALAAYAQNPESWSNYAMALGPPPGEPGCLIPSELLPKQESAA